MTPARIDHIAAVTGAASGIGQATCRRLLEAGWTVFGLDVAKDRLQAVHTEFAAFQNRFHPTVCDVADAASVTTRGRSGVAHRWIQADSGRLSA